MKIVGLCSGHDSAYSIMEDGVIKVHNELERFNRQKNSIGDSAQFYLDQETKNGNTDDVDIFTHVIDSWRGGIRERFKESFSRIKDKFIEVGHHHAHASNAFYTSPFEKALIITVDGGGREIVNGKEFLTAFCAWEGNDIDINPIEITPIDKCNIGTYWSICVSRVFGLGTVVHPQGDQSGTVMGMACLGNPKKYSHLFNLDGIDSYKAIPYFELKEIADRSEQDRFDLASALQYKTEEYFRRKIEPYIKDYKNICLSGGVALNCVMISKIKQWFPQIENIWVDPVPYDGGLPMGASRLIWHMHKRNPRIDWRETSYLGRSYSKDDILNAISNKPVKYSYYVNKAVAKVLAEGNIISVFNQGSESGRRALGNRSILADPRSPKMKDKINEKVKHRQWFRPFAPSILKEETPNWFTEEIDSPTMGFVGQFKKDKAKKVPAVVHHDGSARLQTVTKEFNPWYYDLISEFNKITSVPILLNTSFNDREPIVETPEHAVDCFLRTDIDYLYFAEYEILVQKT